MYTKEESYKLVTANSSKIESPAPTIKSEPGESYSKEESFSLISAQSSKQNEEQKEPVIPKSTWRFEETYALVSNCYDPRSFGRVTKKVNLKILEPVAA